MKLFFKHLPAFAGVTLLLALFLPHTARAANNNFVVYYSDKAKPEAFAPFDLVVLDSDKHPPIQLLREQGKKVLAYISLGEVEKNRSYFPRLQKAGALIQKNENWKDAHMIDVRNPLWTRMVVEDLMPAILAQDFDGIFLDTLDDPPELERRNPARFRGMTQAAVNLVKAIRLNYPNAIIMMNRGYALLPELASTVDSVLGECVYSSYDFKSKTYAKVPEKEYLEQIKILKDAQKKSPNLGVYTLDYWNKNDPATIAGIYRTQRANGFIPYVSTIGLNEVIYEPRQISDR